MGSESVERAVTCDTEVQTDPVSILENLEMPPVNLDIPAPSPNCSLSPDVTHRTSGFN